jgi:two-component system, cell cycle response regulator
VREAVFSMAPVATGEILVVGDEPTRRLVLHHVSSLGIQAVQAEDAARGSEIASLKSEMLECIVLDLGLGGEGPWELLRRLRAEPETAAIPVLAVNARPPTEADLVRIIEAGVIDVVTKPIVAVIFLAKMRAICERSRAQRELRTRLRYALENAALDPLTGLFNRRYFERRLREETAHARRHKRPFALVMIDVDHFKLVNDTFGHEDGDRVLRHVAAIVSASLREDDVACRYGGEEILLLLRATDGLAARVVANRLRSGLAGKPVSLDGGKEMRQVTFSAGVAAADERNAFDAQDIVARADAAMYRAKRAGRNRVESEELERRESPPPVSGR